MCPTAEPASVSLMPMQNRPVAACGDREPAVAELVGAEVLDRARRAVEDELGEDRARHVGAAELLEHDRGFDVAEAGAAPLLADRDAEQLGLADRVPRRLRELLGLVALARHRRERALGDVAGELAQRGLILGVGERIRTLRVLQRVPTGCRRFGRHDRHVRRPARPRLGSVRDADRVALPERASMRATLADPAYGAARWRAGERHRRSRRPPGRACSSRRWARRAAVVGNEQGCAPARDGTAPSRRVAAPRAPTASHHDHDVRRPTAPRRPHGADPRRRGRRPWDAIAPRSRLVVGVRRAGSSGTIPILRSIARGVLRGQRAGARHRDRCREIAPRSSRHVDRGRLARRCTSRRALRARRTWSRSR